MMEADGLDYFGVGAHDEPRSLAARALPLGLGAIGALTALKAFRRPHPIWAALAFAGGLYEAVT